MKLVELLARELEEWPEQESFFCDPDGEIRGTQNTRCDFYPKGSVREKDRGNDFGDESVCTVNQAQWQAERDRQKGGEWKRNRGKKSYSPVADDVFVQVKFRNGDIEEDCGWPRWSHDGGSRDIMSYRIISQPQAEDGLELVQGAKDAAISCLGPFPTAPEGEPLNQLEWDIQFPSGVCSVESKTEQMETPFKWRDEVTELNAYIEKFTRERDELIERLASEGFALIPPVVGVVSEGLPFEDWQDGDIVRCVKRGLSCADLTVGREYVVVCRHGEIGVIDDANDHMISCIENGELELIRRP